MNRKRSLLVLILFPLCAALFAQADDFYGEYYPYWRQARHRSQRSRSRSASRRSSADRFAAAPKADGTPGALAGHSCTRSATRGNSLLCLACNAFLEAGNQSFEGQVQVDRTVMTRVSLGFAPSTCDVIYQHHQFSWTWTRPSYEQRLPRDPGALNSVVAAAQKALLLKGNGATNYYASYIPKPDWAYNCRRSSVVGAHIFLACGAPGGGAAFAKRERSRGREPASDDYDGEYGYGGGYGGEYGGEPEQLAELDLPYTSR